MTADTRAASLEQAQGGVDEVRARVFRAYEDLGNAESCESAEDLLANLRSAQIRLGDALVEVKELVAFARAAQPKGKKR